jgi:hypothetical protein
MKESRKKEINTMADAIEHVATTNPQDFNKGGKFAPGEISSDIQRKKLQTAAEIQATKKLEIPKCLSIPTNGRIYVVSVAGTDMKTPGGLILPPTFAMQKNDQVEGVKRYFVVAWDKDEIPPKFQEKLTVGIEVNPFLPWAAEEWKLPRVIDWDSGNIFEVIHYTELAGVSSNIPEIVEK